MRDRSLLRARRRPRHRAELQHTIAVEQSLANVRLVLVIVAFAALVPLHLGGVWLIFGMLGVCVYATGLAIALRVGFVPRPEQVVALHAADVAGTIFLTLLTGGGASPYTATYFFTLLAAGYRWGRLEVWITVTVAIVVLSLHAAAANLLNWPGAPDPPYVVLRLAYLMLGGVLIGYMSGVERRQRVRALATSRILSFVGSNSNVVTAVHGLLHEMLDLFSASRLVLTVEEDSRDQVTVWQAERAEDPSARPTIKVLQQARQRCPMFVFPVPERVSAWLVSRHKTKGGGEAAPLIALAHEGQDAPADFSIEPLLQTAFPWNRAMVLSYQASHGMHARIFLFLPPGVRASRVDLRELQDIMREVGPAVVNLYLQRRLQSRSAVVERTRISRELHDGVIQALIGVEMQLEVTRRAASGQAPPSLIDELSHIQRIISQEVLDVRDLMQMLRPMDVDAARLVEHLANAVEQFRHRTGIRASFACGVEEIDLPPRVCREIAGIVQEALANVRKHSEATSVLVRLDMADGQWRVTIDDNGKGFDFDGYLSPEEVETQHKGPVLIKERARLINGKLGIHSHPGFGTKLEITIPGKRHA